MPTENETFEIPQEQWQGIVRHPAIDEADRGALNQITHDYFRLSRAPRINYSELRRDVKKALAHERSSLALFDRLINNYNFRAAITNLAEDEISDPAQHQMMREYKKQLIDFYERLHNMVPNKPGKKPNVALSNLFLDVNAFLKNKTGSGLSRKKRDISLLWCLAKSADPKQTRNAVYQVVDYLLKRGKREQDLMVARYSYFMNFINWDTFPRSKKRKRNLATN